MNSKYFIKYATFVTIIFLGVFLSAIQTHTSDDLAAQVLKRKGVLLFFMNPNGRPCQMQAQILQQNQTEIEKHLQIKAISTSDSSNRSLFYHFGVRSLPAIIILNSDGSLRQRFPPGIIPGEYILSIASSGK